MSTYSLSQLRLTRMRSRAPRCRHWSIGVLDCWSIGALWYGNTDSHFPFFYSLLQYSTAPLLHLLELPQEPHVVPVEKLNVVDPVLEHGHPLDSQAKGKPRVDFRVV